MVDNSCFYKIKGDKYVIKNMEKSMYFYINSCMSI